MPAPLVVAGAKVAGKAIAKKVAAKQAAKMTAKAAAKKTAEGVAKKTAQKVGGEAVKSGAKNIPIKRPPSKFTQGYRQARNISDKVDQAQDLVDTVRPKKDEQQKPVKKQTFLDRVFNKQEDQSASTNKFNYRRTFSEKGQSDNENSQPVKKQGKGWYNAAMFMAIWKDAVEIGLNLIALGWLGPILSFFPTIVLSFILFISGKKSTIKIVSYFLVLALDLLLPGFNALPVTVLATLIVFHIKPEAIKGLDQNNTKKGIDIIKKFIK